jgi:hypothetical protein
MPVSDVVDAIRRLAATDPKIYFEGAGPSASSVEPPAPYDRAPIEEAFAATLPEDLVELYQLSGGMDLFRDVEGSLLGVRVFSPSELLVEGRDKIRWFPENFRRGDIVFAKVYGDDCWFLVRGDSRQDDFGSVIYMPEIAPRSEWKWVARSITSFLAQLVEARGQPHWPDWGDAGPPLC